MEKVLFATTLLFLFINSALAAETTQSENEKVNVDSIKEKYWAQGNEAELGVVQNRLYSKENKFDLSVFGGITSSDPFLSVKNVGTSFGFHFSEFLSAHIIGWKSFVSDSSALTTFKSKMGATTNSNPPRWFLGAEASASLIYGKLSLLGKSILYYDLHFLAGAGVTGTDNGNYPTPFAGLGQQIYISKNVSLKVDYRIMLYRERIIERAIPIKGVYGTDRGGRANWSHVVVVGFDILFGGAQ